MREEKTRKTPRLLSKPFVAIALLVLGMGIGAFAFQAAPSDSIGEGLTYHSLICACKNSADGSCNEANAVGPCKHNTVSIYGKNATRDYLSVDGARQAFDALALSNWTPDIANAVNLTVELAGGLARGGAGVINWSSNGNWSLIKTWTADGQFLNVNTTAVFNDTAAGKRTMLCGGTFTPVNLESGDTLTINYTLWIS